jgi:hypothetical protein
MTATENEARIDRQRYLFECMLRSPVFQKDFSEFVRQYPVFFRFHKNVIASDRTVAEKQTTKLWELFLKKIQQRLLKIDESHESIIFKYVFSGDRASVELGEWEGRIRTLEFRVGVAADELYGAEQPGPVLERIFSDLHGGRRSLLSFGPGAEYLDLAHCSAEDFELARKRFNDKWGMFPHHVGMRWEPAVMLRDDVERSDSSVKLFIPVSGLTTKDDLEKSWVEIAEMQKAIYGKKRRPGRAHYGELLKIYDLWRTRSSTVIARQMGITKSAAEKRYRRVYMDVHGVAGPGRKPKGQEIDRRRKQKRIVKLMEGDARIEFSAELLRRVCVEQNIPISKLEAADTPSDFRKTLTLKEKNRLFDGLIALNQERQRRGGR